MSRVYNFSPGPAMIPEAVLTEVRDSLLNWHRTGMSVMELPHRGQDFKDIAIEAEKDIRDLYNIPNNYSVLFMQGGARMYYAAIPMNLLANHTCTAYVNSGAWSEKAIKEAEQYSKVQVVASGASSNFTSLPDQQHWQTPEDAAYLHYVDNETIAGVEFSYVPDAGDLPLICDMTSNFLSRTVDVSKYGVIYASAQKNAGMAGLVVMIIRDDLIARTPMRNTPSMLNFSNIAKASSLLNTPPTFAWYVAGLVFKWIKEQGGLEGMAAVNERKAKKLYAFIDDNAFYSNSIDIAYRSRMNVSFCLRDETLNQQFLEEATKGGLRNLKGHRLSGGMRASIYNAMPELGIDTLIAFMRDFSKRYG